MLHKYKDVPCLNYCYNVVASDMFRYKGNVLFDEGAVKLYHFVGTCWDKKLWQANTVHLYNEDCHELMYSYIEEFNKVIKEYNEGIESTKKSDKVELDKLKEKKQKFEKEKFFELENQNEKDSVKVSFK